MNSYQHAFSELVTGMSEIDSALQKSLYAMTPAMVSATCTEVFGKAMSAQMAMGELPFSNYELEQMSSFITRVGDYSFMLSRNAANGSGYSDEEYENLMALSQTATLLSDNLIQLLAEMNSGTISISDIRAAEKKASSTESEISQAVLGDSFKVIESEFPEIPSLIYDGPFSEHILQMTPKYLEGRGEIDSYTAIEIAAGFMNLRPEIFTFDGERAGTVPVFRVSADVDGGKLYVEVSKQGGIVITVLNSRIVDKSVMAPEDAASIAREFLEDSGYDNMHESYWMVENNTVTVNFAYEQDDVICYTDLIKVSVALDSGRLTGFESLGYVMSHVEREIPEALVSREDAEKMVSDRLEILSHSMAVIPTAGKNEVFCHEFICETEDGRHYITYVNAVSGNQEKILILIENDNGTLTL